MVGIHGSADIVRRRPALLAALLFAAAVCASLLADSPAAAGPGSGCSPPPNTLAPKGSPGKRYTMMLRIQKDKNIADYVNGDLDSGGLHKRIRDQDIFVINTRMKDSSPEEWVAWAESLRQNFPCNRIVSLNGLGSDSTQPGYAFALANNPGVWGLSIDWESGDWGQSQKQKPGTPGWTTDFGTTRTRIGKRLAQLGEASSDAVGTPGRRTGVVPAYYSSWEYGLIAKTADRRNATRKKGRRGFQVVQSQGYCAPSTPVPFIGLADTLLHQYRPPPRTKTIRNKKGKVVKKVKIKVKPRSIPNNLAMEVSFSNTPDPTDPRPVASLAPGAASKCTQAGLKRGIGAFLYWAHPDSIRAFLNTSRMCKLRPPCP